MNFVQLEYFLALVETLNYTKASKILHITQPNLSKMIVNLEHEIGVQLFQRSKRDVRLTQAGEAFYREITKAMCSYAAAVEQARNVESGTSGTINVGFLGTAVIRLIPPIINRFRAAYPQISVNLMDYTYSPLMEALAEEQIDLAILPDRELDSIPQLVRKFLYSDSMCAAVPKEHRLAKSEEADLWELKSEPFVMMSPRVSSRDYDLVMNMCLEQDFLPKVAYEANSMINLLMMVECHVGIAILAEHMTHFATAGVRFVKIRGYENYFKMVCAWRRDRNPSIPKLIEVFDSVDIAAGGVSRLGD